MARSPGRHSQDGRRIRIAVAAACRLKPRCTRRSAFFKTPVASGMAGDQPPGLSADGARESGDQRLERGNIEQKNQDRAGGEAPGKGRSHMTNSLAPTDGDLPLTHAAPRLFGRAPALRVA